jgi:hypothetical protein
MNEERRRKTTATKFFMAVSTKEAAGPWVNLPPGLRGRMHEKAKALTGVTDRDGSP